MMTNTPTTTLPLMEAFYTIQGEGYHQGRAAYFIRLGGCDVGCHWCDVKDSWDFTKWPNVACEEIVRNATANPSRLVVITGGEPLMHNLDNLTSALIHSGFKTNIETSGAYPLSGKWDWICLSPKKFKAPLDSVFEVCDELKMIIYNQSDFEFAEQHRQKVLQSCNKKSVKFFLQPEWSRSQEMNPLIIDYVKSHPEWQISLQVHKFLDIP